MNKNHISFLLSGGFTNVLPNKSLGGPISQQIIDMGNDNLFDDITRKQSFSGHIDYRCFYIRNENQDEKLKDCSIYVHKAIEGSEINIGLSLQSDVQALIVSGSPHAGSFQLQYTLNHAGETHIQTTREINWVPNENTMSQRIAAVLNSLDFLKGVLCTGHQSSGGFDFLITFGGSSSGRAQELLAVVNKEGVNAKTTYVTKGGPINSIAPNIGFSNNAPSNVEFFETDKSTPITIGTLFPGDFFPVWLRRTVNQNTKPIHPDSCNIHLFGEPLPIQTSNSIFDSNRKVARN